MANEVVFTVVFLGLAAYFTVMVARTMHGYLLFRRLRPSAVLTWRVRRPAQLTFLLALGVVAALVALLNAYMRRPLHHVYSQAIMAAYFIVMVPLTFRIQRGLYADGVWAEGGYLPYARIGRMAFVETPEIVLLLVPRGRAGPFRLRVPPAEYGAVRKLLEEKIRSRAVQMEEAILGL
ncbi:MAG TPA: hypothetical protein VII13_03100 [Vicinamibacteria bacterium]